MGPAATTKGHACLRYALLLLTAICPTPLSAASDRLQIELWCDLDPIVQEGVGQAADSIPTEEAVRRLLEEARIVLSGMIYGYRFSFTPSDSLRQVPERFELASRAEIGWGDPRLRVAATRLEGHRLHALIRYELTPEQQGWRDAWQTAPIAKAAGEGTGNVFLGYREREETLRRAVKGSVRSYLRPRVPNKPREVRGEVLLWEVPGTYVDAGEYHTRVITRLRIEEITPYRFY